MFEPDLGSLRHHGDADVESGMVDFAVNVAAPGPPGWLRNRLAARLDSLGSYPSVAEAQRACAAVAARHGRSSDEVLLLAGGAEGFALLPRLGPTLAAVVHPSFTEPDVVLHDAGVPVRRVVLEPPFEVADADVPADADLVVVGNPTNPTSVLHPAGAILALRRPGRIVVVDEAFADAVVGERESLAGLPLPDVVVLRSLTKTWSLAGLRCGYALGPPDLLERLALGRAHWPLGTLQLEAITACSEPFAVAAAAERALRLGAEREALIGLLAGAGFAVHTPAAAPFVLVDVPDGDLLRKRLRANGIAVRRGDTFPGLGPNRLRVAVRDEARSAALVAAMEQLA